jgi:hypothetical protein
MAHLSTPNLATDQHHSQQQKIRCKLAIHHLATYIGYLIFDELPTERNFRRFEFIFQIIDISQHLSDRLMSKSCIYIYLFLLYISLLLSIG